MKPSDGRPLSSAMPGALVSGSLAMLAFVGLAAQASPGQSLRVRLLFPILTGLEYEQIAPMAPQATIVDVGGQSFVEVASFEDARVAHQLGLSIQKRVPIPFDLAFDPNHPQLGIALGGESPRSSATIARAPIRPIQPAPTLAELFAPAPDRGLRGMQRPETHASLSRLSPQRRETQGATALGALSLETVLNQVPSSSANPFPGPALAPVTTPLGSAPAAPDAITALATAFSTPQLRSAPSTAPTTPRPAPAEATGSATPRPAPALAIAPAANATAPAAAHSAPAPTAAPTAPRLSAAQATAPAAPRTAPALAAAPSTPRLAAALAAAPSTPRPAPAQPTATPRPTPAQTATPAGPRNTTALAAGPTTPSVSETVVSPASAAHAAQLGPSHGVPPAAEADVATAEPAIQPDSASDAWEEAEPLSSVPVPLASEWVAPVQTAISPARSPGRQTPAGQAEASSRPAPPLEASPIATATAPAPTPNQPQPLPHRSEAFLGSVPLPITSEQQPQSSGSMPPQAIAAAPIGSPAPASVAVEASSPVAAARPAAPMMPAVVTAKPDPTPTHQARTQSGSAPVSNPQRTSTPATAALLSPAAPSPGPIAESATTLATVPPVATWPDELAELVAAPVDDGFESLLRDLLEPQPLRAAEASAVARARPAPESPTIASDPWLQPVPAAALALGVPVTRFQPSLNGEIDYLYVKLQQPADLERLRRVMPVEELNLHDGMILARVGVFTRSSQGRTLRGNRMEILRRQGLELLLVQGNPAQAVT